MNDYSAIGKRGQARRRHLQLTVAEVARRLGIRTRCVYQYECYGVGTICVLEAWARALEMDPRELAFGPYTDAEARADREANQRHREWCLRQLGS